MIGLPRRKGSVSRAVCLAAVIFFSASGVAAQAPLSLVNERTTVSRISFNFVESQTFEEGLLKEQIALADPSFWDRLRRILPLTSPAPHPFDPITLQRDVARLRLYYNNHGFLHPEIDYPASQLDTASNTIRIIFMIEEGPPVIIQDVGFFGPDGRFAAYQFDEATRPGWNDFRTSMSVRTGDRYTDFDRVRIQDEAVSWMKDQGYAFAQIAANITIDSLANTADLRFVVAPGPLAYIDTIQIEGNESVGRGIVERELPFKPGDRFRHTRLVRGQRELFGLNLFRLALVEVPEQPRDSTVDVRVRLREASPRYVTAQTGYGRETGALMEGTWAHRNFFGGARDFNANLVVNSGYLATLSASDLPSRLFRGSISIRQPYLFVGPLSGLISPFIQFESDPLLQIDPSLKQDRPFDLNIREVGLNSTLIYELMPYRTISLQHSFSRSQFLQPTIAVEGTTNDRFNKSIFTLSGVFGKTDDFIRPSRGLLVRPFVEGAGSLIASDINYTKIGTELTSYLPVGDRMSVGVRLYGGHIQLLGGSRYEEHSLFGMDGRILEAQHHLALLENRFDRIRFYAGGGDDVRGWGFRRLGPVVARADTVVFDEAGNPRAVNARIEELGGLGKVAGNLELRMPFPGLGSLWHSAVFLDFGQVYERRPALDDLRFALGTGIRYETLVGFIRLDVAVKLNPTLEDLNNPENIYLYRTQHIGRDDLPSPWLRRIGVHFSIGQAF